MTARQPYRTAWMFVDRAHADKAFFTMLQNAMADTPLFRNKQLFFQYTTLLYVAGARRIEPFLRPITIQKSDNDGNVFFKVTHVNSKHFNGSRLRCICGIEFMSVRKLRVHQAETQHSGYANVANRKILSAIFFTFNEYEKALLEYLLQGRTQITIDFSRLLPASVQKTFVEGVPIDIAKLEAVLPVIDKKFRMFKASITDGQRVVENGSIVPHMLRHLRAYDLIAHGTPPHLVQRLLGWDSRDMVDRYADINGFVNDAETLAMWQTTIAHAQTGKTIFTRANPLQP